MSQYCHTCSRTVEDAVAYRCPRPFCQGRKEAEKDAKAAQQKKWAEEDKPDAWDGMAAGSEYNPYAAGDNMITSSGPNPYTYPLTDGDSN